MNLEENEHILENKELKTNSQKKRLLFVNNSDEAYFTNGTVTLIHQEQFNQLKKEYHELKENVEDIVDNEELAKLEKQIKDLQEENQKLKEKIESIESEKYSLEEKVGAKSEIIEEIKFPYDERINDLKEDKTILQSEIKDINEKNISLKLALNDIIHEYNKIKNRSLIGRIFNSETIEITEYKKLVENKPTYILDTKEE